MNNTLLAVVGFCIAVSFAVTSGLPLLGSLAWANNTETKIKEVTVPIQQKVDKMERQLRGMIQRQETREVADLRQKLFETRIAQCKARARQGETDNPYSDRMDELQGAYYQLTKTYYVAAPCEDL